MHAFFQSDRIKSRDVVNKVGSLHILKEIHTAKLECDGARQSTDNKQFFQFGTVAIDQILGKSVWTIRERDVKV